MKPYIKSSLAAMRGMMVKMRSLKKARRQELQKDLREIDYAPSGTTPDIEEHSVTEDDELQEVLGLQAKDASLRFRFGQLRIR